MLERILVPVDGSAHAEKAVAFAADLAAKYGAELTLLHVVQGHDLPPEFERLAEIEQLGSTSGEVFRTLGQRILESAQEIAVRHGTPKASLMLENGDPASVVLEAARQHRADAIVMGCRGLGRFKVLVLGSVSHKVATHAPCTVVTVK